MVKNLSFVIIFIVLILNNVISQTISKNSDIKITVNTEAIDYTDKPQQLSLEISKSANENPRLLKISIDKLDAILTLVNATVNGEKIWLINSDSSSANTKVLAWNYDKKESNLLLYPSNWGVSYILGLDVQANLKTQENNITDESAEVKLIADMAGIVTEAAVAGRGNEIKINKQ